MGGRSARVFDSLTRQPDCQFVLGCEVSQTKLQTFQAANRPLAQIPIVGDYRKVLDRNDVDAVLIATPDFSHSKIMVDAVAAGKDVYVEKPISNSVPRQHKRAGPCPAAEHERAGPEPQVLEDQRRRARQRRDDVVDEAA